MNKHEMLIKAQQGDVSIIEEVALNYYRGINGFEENNDNAFYWFSEAVRLNPQSVVGLNGLGNCYYSGYGIQQDQAKGMAYYRKAAELGFSNSQYNLAKHLEEENDRECLLWYTKAAEQGDGDAFFRLYSIYREGRLTEKDVVKAAQCLENAGQLKNLDAMLTLGCLYETGEDGIVSPNKEKSLEWMTAAANEGSSAAMNNLAISYRIGDIVEPNIETAIEWAKKASEKGNGDQLFIIAAEFKAGENRAKDQAKAIELFRFGAEHGHDRSMVELAFNELGPIEKIRDAKPDQARTALEWVKKAAVIGNNTAFSLLLGLSDIAYGEEKGKEVYFQTAKEGADNGYFYCMYETFRCYRQGYGTEQNTQDALKYLQRAADGEWPQALYQLADLYSNGYMGIEVDEGKAFELYKKASERGYVDAYNILGDCYREGKGTEKNIQSSIQWYQRSVEEGTGANAASSAFWLGVLFFEGKEVEQDFIKSLGYFEKANDPAYPNPMVQSMLDTFYSDGKMKENVDPEKAKAFYRSKAESGDPHAMFEMGQYTENNIVFPGDEAISWYKKAAEAGDVNAQWRLGFHYMASDDEIEAAKFLEMGAGQDHPGCLVHMANYLINGSKLIPQDSAKAFSYYCRAADKGNAEACYKKGQCYQVGLGTVKDDSEAFTSFKRAQELGCKDMWFELGECYRQGAGTPANMQMALECYRHGAEEENCHFCQRNLGYYYSGNLGEKSVFDIDLARKYLDPLADGDDPDFAPMAQFVLGLAAENAGDTEEMLRRMNQAANNGIDNALMKLGFYYVLGDKGVSKNLNNAKHYFTLAANKGVADASDMLAEVQKLEKQQANQAVNQTNTSQNTSQSADSSGGCYVATCVYGSYDCPEVWTLRRFRDYTLAETWYGMLFIRLYYCISPTIVKWFGHTTWFTRIWRGKLDRIVSALKRRGVEDTPYSDRVIF